MNSQSNVQKAVNDILEERLSLDKFSPVRQKVAKTMNGENSITLMFALMDVAFEVAEDLLQQPGGQLPYILLSSRMKSLDEELRQDYGIVGEIHVK